MALVHLAIIKTFKLKIEHFLDQWIYSITCNAAIIVLITSHFDISVQAPIFTPRILYQPVVKSTSFVRSISNDQHLNVNYVLLVFEIP